MKTQVYHDINLNVLFTIKRRCKNFLLVGGIVSPYYNDAITSHTRYHLDYNYFYQNCVAVSTNSPAFDKTQFGHKLKLPIAATTKTMKHYKYQKKLTREIVIRNTSHLYKEANLGN